MSGICPNPGVWRMLPGSYQGFDSWVSPGALPRPPWVSIQNVEEASE